MTLSPDGHDKIPAQWALAFGCNWIYTCETFINKRSVKRTETETRLQRREEQKMKNVTKLTKMFDERKKERTKKAGWRGSDRKTRPDRTEPNRIVVSLFEVPLPLPLPKGSGTSPPTFRAIWGQTLGIVDIDRPGERVHESFGGRFRICENRRAGASPPRDAES
jgi:hypothetical protein